MQPFQCENTVVEVLGVPMFMFFCSFVFKANSGTRFYRFFINFGGPWDLVLVPWGSILRSVANLFVQCLFSTIFNGFWVAAGVAQGDETIRWEWVPGPVFSDIWG